MNGTNNLPFINAKAKKFFNNLMYDKFNLNIYYKNVILNSVYNIKFRKLKKIVFNITFSFKKFNLT